MKICRVSEPGLTYISSSELKLISGDWDSLLPENHPLESRKLLAIEESALPDLRFHYLLISKNNQLAGCAYFQHFHFHAGHYDSRVLGQGPLFYLSQLLLCQETGILVCGNLFHLGTEGFFFAHPENRDAILPIVSEMEKKWKPGAVLIKDVQQGLRHALIKSGGFSLYEQDQVMNLEIQPHWKTFNDYLSELGKKYRQRANRILNSAAHLSFRILDEQEIHLRAVEMETLYGQVRQKQSLRIGSLNAAYFTNMKKALGKSFEIRAWFDESGKMLAFSSHFLHEGGQREVHYIGFDYQANEEFSLYFNILFDGVKAAIETGNPIVWFGRTGFDAKASTGAVPESNLHYFRIKNGLPAFTFKVLRKALSGKENDNWKNRSPFRRAGQEPLLQEV